MRVVALSLMAIALTAIGAAASVDYVSQFDSFKKTFKRSYSSPSEEAMRLGYFVRNMQNAAQLQALNPHATFGANEFSDLSEEEFKPMHNAEGQFRAAAHSRKQRSKRGQSTMLELKSDAVTAQAVDWRQKGAVTPPKNQGLKCGSCWSFSTTGNIEGQWAIAGNGLVSLSEQELVSCDTTCNACHGGLPDLAFEWIINARGGGITSEAQWPYSSGWGTVPACDASGKTPVAFISGYKDIAHSEASMAAVVSAKGPVSIGVDGSSFQSYTGGILTSCQAVQVDHAVLIVGYDLSNSPPYWIIKNSWGTTWGEGGFIRVAYGQNECLLTTAPSISEVSANPPPVPPTGPPAPPLPPPPAGSTFTQSTCTDSACSVGCQKNTLPTGECIGMQGGGSVVATCGTNNLHLQIFSGSSSCQGSYNATTQPLNQCFQDTTGGYVENTCSGKSSSGSGSGSASQTSSSGGNIAATSKSMKVIPRGEARVQQLKSKHQNKIGRH